jgi:hypothetical protein
MKPYYIFAPILYIYGGIEDTASIYIPQSLDFELIFDQDLLNQMQDQLYLDPSNIEPEKYREAIDIGQGQIKDMELKINKIAQEQKKSLELDITCLKGNCNKLQEIYNSIQNLKSASSNREAAISQYNAELNRKILETQELINSNTLAIAECHIDISNSQLVIERTKEDIQKSVHLINRKTILPLIKNIQKNPHALSILRSAISLATGSTENSDYEIIELWRNVDKAKAVLHGYNHATLKEQVYVAANAMITQVECKLTDKYNELRNICSICNSMIKAASCYNGLIKAQENEEKVRLKTD